jgi:hypothetical protein
LLLLNGFQLFIAGFAGALKSSIEFALVLRELLLCSELWKEKCDEMVQKRNHDGDIRRLLYALSSPILHMGL